jgi:hypothetical protein
MTMALVLSGFNPQRVLAHSQVQVGPYVLIIGWLEEPVIAGERNAIVLEVTENEAPVVGVESALQLTILYGGRTFIANLRPAGQPGRYTAEILPTVRGQYTVQLSGKIGETVVDERLEPEEVLSPQVLQFPESPPDLSELEQTIQSLASQLRTAQLLALVGVGLGLAATVVAIIALRGRSG